MTKPHPRRAGPLTGGRAVSVLVSTVLIALIAHLVMPMTQAGGVTPATINGLASSYTAPLVSSWLSDTGQAPYSLSVTSGVTSSNQARYEFTDGIVDFAVSDIGYVASTIGDVPPSFPYTYIPLVGAGIAFNYNIPGLTQTLQLTSYSACLVMTGQGTDWDDPVFHLNGANAGITLPDLAIVPVTESDPASTNLAVEQYCVDQQPAVWSRYAQNMAAKGPPPSGVPISATTAGANLGGTRQRVRRAIHIRRCV